MSLTSIKSFKQINITPSLCLSIVLIQAAIIALASYFTYEYYNTPLHLKYKIDQKINQLSDEQKQISLLKSQTSAQINVLAQRVGMLTARMNRIDALGERLVQTNEFSEFDFENLPALGGPEQVDKITQESELGSLITQIDRLLIHVDDQQSQLELFETVILNHEIHNDSLISGRPINKGWLSSLYGMRNDPFNGKLTMHKGVDFAGKDGDSIMATGAGVVTWSGKRYGYGLLVEIDHGAGLKTRYAHAKELRVDVGDVVSKGEIIALMGNTGRSTGAHVHYEVLQKDQQINPRKYIYR